MIWFTLSSVGSSWRDLFLLIASFNCIISVINSSFILPPELVLLSLSGLELLNLELRDKNRGLPGGTFNPVTVLVVLPCLHPVVWQVRAGVCGGGEVLSKAFCVGQAPFGN